MIETFQQKMSEKNVRTTRPSACFVLLPASDKRWINIKSNPKLILMIYKYNLIAFEWSIFMPMWFISWLNVCRSLNTDEFVVWSAISYFNWRTFHSRWNRFTSFLESRDSLVPGSAKINVIGECWHGNKLNMKRDNTSLLCRSKMYFYRFLFYRH